MGDLFEKLYAVDPLENSSCNMWWDLLVHGHFETSYIPWRPIINNDDDAQTQNVMFETIYRILNLNSRECQMSALHGLGHLHHPLTEQVLDDFLETHPKIDDDIREYLLKSRAGEIQ